jgi:hypothetical protein
MKIQTYEEFLKEGEELFGPDRKDWRFQCISCKGVQTYKDFDRLGVKNIENVVHFSCIGRYGKKGHCDWTLGGLFTIHTKEVMKDGKANPAFEFAPLFKSPKK